MHDSDHYSVGRILAGLSWELYCQIVHSSDGGQRGTIGLITTTKVSFCTIIVPLCYCMIVIAMDFLHKMAFLSSCQRQLDTIMLQYQVHKKLLHFCRFWANSCDRTFVIIQMISAPPSITRKKHDIVGRAWWSTRTEHGAVTCIWLSSECGWTLGHRKSHKIYTVYTGTVSQAWL